MPDATGLELLAGELKDADEASVLGTLHFRGQATILADPRHIRDILLRLRGAGYKHLMSIHGVDYFPEEPRLGVHYELLDRVKKDRVRVKVRLHTDAAHIESVTADWPTADHQEREVYDMFGVVFEGHHDLRRILMPEDYEGHPQRRDFPIGGEPILFTKDQVAGSDYTQ